MKEVITEILKISVNAPSGHNCQPWRFMVKEDDLFVWNIPGKDKTLFNYQQRGSLIGQGALIENIVISAWGKGYQANVILFPQAEEQDLIAQINLEKNSSAYPYCHLFPCISERATNRRPYKKIPFKMEDGRKLEEFFEEVKKVGFEIVLTQDERTIHQAANALSMADRLVFENPYIHKALFDNVNWTLKEELEKREGLYVGTKELSFLERVIFRYFLSKWSMVSRLSKIRISEKAAQKRQKLYQQCSAIGLILTPNDTPQSFVESGRILQRFWLYITSLGLSFQPISVGLLYLGQRLQRELVPEFTTKQAELVKDAYQNVTGIFKISGSIPVFSFRLGYANPPSAVSIKTLPEIAYYD